jgi:hypothetical protein
MTIAANNPTISAVGRQVNPRVQGSMSAVRQPVFRVPHRARVTLDPQDGSDAHPG